MIHGFYLSSDLSTLGHGLRDICIEGFISKFCLVKAYFLLHYLFHIKKVLYIYK